MNKKEIINLPDDVLNIILEYIPVKKIITLNNKYYNLYHHLIKNRINSYESYTRDMIRRDYGYIFDRLLRENFDNWINNRKYRHKDMIFNNYIYFVLYFCIENNSEDCLNILRLELSNRDLLLNLHKKNIIKYINGKFKC